LLATGLAVAAGVLIGVQAERDDVPGRLARRFDIEQRLAALQVNLGLGERDAQRAQWRRVVLNQHTLEWSSIRVRPPGVRGGALVEIGGHIVLASPLGRFSHLGPDNRLRPLDLQAPNNLEALRGSALLDNPLFSAAEFRVHDLAARQTGADAWELYATLSRFEREDCYRFQVVRVRLTANGGALALASPDWEHVYTARPGCIPSKDRGWLFQGVEAGGRMAFTSDRTMLVSIGDHQFDGFNDRRAVAMDPDWDLGKLIELDVTTGEARIYASGLRNPQGLVVMRDGRIFSTEHGPQGGDEINFIREGANYGWPLVSYGMNYGFPRREWASDPAPGGHAGYARPALAFTPAIGISNLVQPSADEFPLWRDNDILMLSLRAGTLFHVAVHEGEVAYVEPIEFDAHLLARQRLRDIIALRDGRLAILTDSGNLMFLRNAERHADAPREFVVRGYGDLSPPLPEELFDNTGTRAERGRRFFQMGCASCHSLGGHIGAGPPLNGVVGRRIGSVSGFNYSAALAEQNGSWDEHLLRSFILDPENTMHGTTMPEPPISWTMAPEIVDYLETTR
jgi:glucose/arabinose dehydrogenase/cytochrome c2